MIYARWMWLNFWDAIKGYTEDMKRYKGDTNMGIDETGGTV